VSRSDDAIRDEIIEVGRRLYERGLIAATEGNISVRTGDGLLATAGGVSKGFLTRELVLRTDLEGRPLEPARPVSSEIAMHAAIYRCRPDARAVVHAHPPAATAFAVAHAPLDQPLLAEAVLLLGPVPLVRYAPPSTAELAEAVAEAFASTARAVLLANHGAVALGETLPRAHQRMETLEHLARVTLLARTLGQPRALPPEEVERLLQLPTAPYR
jgi:L-fuculose-phosphate aldolase